MKFKVVPPAPDSLDRLFAVRDAVPVVPDGEESCCARLVSDADVPAQDEAKEWLTFCRALGLVEAGPRGYSRAREDVPVETLRERFRANVYGAGEALAVLASAGEPLQSDAVFDRVRDDVPAWERRRRADWQAAWRDRTARLLAWAALFGLVEREGDGYVSV